MEITTTVPGIFTKGLIFISILLNIAAGYLLLLTGANILLATSKILLITLTILQLFKIEVEKGERIDQSLIILLYTSTPELESSVSVRALCSALRVIQAIHKLGETLEDYSTQLHLTVKSIPTSMADTAKRSTRTQTQTMSQPQSKHSTHSRKPRPHPIDTSVANQYRSWQRVAARVANDDNIPTASSVYSDPESDTEDPFADQATYEELPLPNIRMRTPAPAPAPARSIPYSTQPSEPTTKYPHAHSTRLTNLVSALPRLDTSVADHGPYNRDWELKEFPPVTGLWAHFYTAGQLWLANDLLGWWEGYPSPGSDGVCSDRSQCGDEERDDSEYNGWEGLPSPISPLGLGEWIW